MKDSDFQLLVTSVQQAGRIKRGEMPARKIEVKPEDVKAIRSKLQKSQSEFALMSLSEAEVEIAHDELTPVEDLRRKP